MISNQDMIYYLTIYQQFFFCFSLVGLVASKCNFCDQCGAQEQEVEHLSGSYPDLKYIPGGYTGNGDVNMNLISDTNAKYHSPLTVVMNLDSALLLSQVMVQSYEEDACI